MNDFQLSFASILKYISIVLIVIGVISIPVAIFLGFGRVFSTAFSEIFRNNTKAVARAKREKPV